MTHPTPTPSLAVSACLAGIPCRYDGAARPDPQIAELVRRGEARPVCAEVLAGMPTPRPAAEILGGDGQDVLNGKARVVDQNGCDLTDDFVRGARAAADAVIEAGATRAVLQSRTTSCGCTQIYDGSHRGAIRPGIGVFAAELRRRGILTEERRGGNA